MSKIDDARVILQSIGMPDKQQSDLCCYALLAMCCIDKSTPWCNATNTWMRIHDILQFTKDSYQIVYAENSRETFRKQAMHQFRDAALTADNGEATNSPKYKYRITEEALKLIKSFESKKWDGELQNFKQEHESLISLYSSKKEVQKMSVGINGIDLKFSTGSHNKLQKAILEEFAPRFVGETFKLLYVGDSSDRDLHKETNKLAQLGFAITKHDKMPDVVLYREDVDWIYFIEAVTSVGPMSQKRVNDINKMTTNVKSGKIFVTAFPDLKTFKKFSESLAWETEVWLSDRPEHMIHFNGDKFLGPYKK